MILCLITIINRRNSFRKNSRTKSHRRRSMMSRQVLRGEFERLVYRLGYLNLINSRMSAQAAATRGNPTAYIWRCSPNGQPVQFIYLLAHSLVFSFLCLKETRPGSVVPKTNRRKSNGLFRIGSAAIQQTHVVNFNKFSWARFVSLT